MDTVTTPPPRPATPPRGHPEALRGHPEALRCDPDAPWERPEVLRVRPVLVAEPGGRDRQGRHEGDGVAARRGGAPAAGEPSPTSGAGGTSSNARAGGGDTGDRGDTGGAGPREARAVAAILRLALEIVDGRRPAERYQAVFGARTAEMLRVRARTNRVGALLGPARLRRVHIDGAGPAGREAVEVSATYARGDRLFALAGRVEFDDQRARCTALRIG